MEELQQIKNQLDRMESKQNGEYLRMDKEIKEHTKIDEEKFKKQDDAHFEFDKKLNFIASKVKEPTEEEKIQAEKIFDERIEKAMIKALGSFGTWSYGKLIVVAGVVGALLIIFGGFTKLLAFIGFTRN